MADIPANEPLRGWMWQPIWQVAADRAKAGSYYISGGCANEQAPPDMTIQVDELVTKVGTTVAGNVTIDAPHDTQARMDILYQTALGAFAIHKGDNATIDDPLGTYDPSTHANWQGLAAPYPKAALPAGGIPLYIVYVGPAVTAIYDKDLMPVAARGIVIGTAWVWETMSDTDTTHTLGHSPVAGSLSAYRNGVLIMEGSGSGYTRSGTGVTLTTARGSDVILFHYQY
jgi:hypothetical protein